MITREKTRVVHIGGVPVGGGSPIVIQSMTNTDTRDVTATVNQIRKLQDAGCEIIRVAVPDMEAADAIKKIKAQINIPLVADIHFDHRLALAAIKNGVDKIRINPGNIGSELKAREVAEAAKAAGIPIRIGVNGGSLEKDILAKYGGITAQGLIESATRHVSILEKYNFENIVLAIKASNVSLLLEAHKLLAKDFPYPLHVGLTEAGTAYNGAIRSAAGIGAILSMGLGDTIRVSLAGDPVKEIHAAKEILAAMGLRKFGPVVVACPTCGRTEIDMIPLAERIEKRLESITKPITVAVMGCVVNGPGEARDADIGIASGKGEGLIFKKGEIVRKVKEKDLEDALFEEIQTL